MKASKTKVVNGYSIKEYYWAGDYVVYVDNWLVKTNFNDTVAAAERGTDFIWAVPRTGSNPA